MKSLSILTKMNLLIFICILTIGGIISIVVKAQVEESMLDTYEKNLYSISSLSYSYLDAAFAGNWQINNGELYKGTTAAANFNDFLDAIGEQNEIVSTIFLNDTRIATTVKTNGERAVGTKASKAVSEVVLKGQNYVGTAQVVGKQHLTIYTPIVDASGKVIGMWFIGKPIDEIYDTISSTMMLIYGVILIVGTLTLFISVSIVRTIIRPIRKINDQLKTIAQGGGDLTQTLPITTKDEVGELATSFNYMLKTLRIMMKEIHETSTEITVACEDLYASATQTTALTNETTNTLHSIALGSKTQVAAATNSESNIEALRAHIHHVSQFMDSMATSSDHSKMEAQQGNKVIQQVVMQIQEIHQSVKETEQVIQELSAQSNEINLISDMITAISEQTNLLALNATIEAARAGEYGKGFAVVANEVRHLAEQSKQSAQQITTLIDAVQENTSKAVHLMSKGSGEVTSGLAKVKQSDAAFNNIASSINELNSQFAVISQLTLTMAQNIQDVHSKTVEVVAIAEQSADSTLAVSDFSDQQLASMEEISASAKSLEDGADHLQQLIQRFKF